MTVLRGFMITIASGIAFAFVGTGVGYTIGKYAPDYYRIVFSIPPEIELDPVQAGVGLGVTQGLAAGFVHWLGHCLCCSMVQFTDCKSFAIKATFHLFYILETTSRIGDLECYPTVILSQHFSLSS